MTTHPDRSMAEAFDAGVLAAQIPASDSAAVQLARKYAQTIDDGEIEELITVGPKLLAALTALGMTVSGRGAKGGPSAPAVPDEVGQRRARAAARRQRSAARSD